MTDMTTAEPLDAFLGKPFSRYAQVFNAPATPQGVYRQVLKHQDHIVCQSAFYFGLNNGLLQFPGLPVFGQGQFDI